MQEMMNVIIVESSTVLCNAVQSALSDITGIKVVGHAVSESGAIKCIDTLLPDAVILSLNLQSGSGVGVLESVKKHHAEIKVMMMSNYNEEFYMAHCKRAKADYFCDISSQILEFRGVLRGWAHANCLDNKLRSGSQSNAWQEPGKIHL